MANLELIKSAFSRDLGRSIKILAEFSHSQFDETFRIVDNTEAITIDGDTFSPYPFKFIQNSQGETQGATLALSNVDRNIARQIKKATTNENIVCKIWICQIEKDDVLNVERYESGTFEVFSPVITKEATAINLNLRVSIEYNVGTVRYNTNLFPNLYL